MSLRAVWPFVSPNNHPVAGMKARLWSIEFNDRRESTRLALVPDEKNRVRKFNEHTAAAPALFVDDEGPIRIETDHEIKRPAGVPAT